MRAITPVKMAAVSRVVHIISAKSATRNGETIRAMMFVELIVISLIVYR